MASTSAALKCTSEGQTLGPIGSERRRQSSPPPHRLTNGGEVGWPDSQFSLFSGDGPFYSFDVAKFLESISGAASRPAGEERSQELAALGAGSPASWVDLTRARPGSPGAGVQWKETAHPGTPSQPRAGTALSRCLHPTSDPAEPPKAPVSSARITVLQNLQGRTSQPWTGLGVGVPGRYSSTFSHQRPSAPRPVASAGLGSWRIVDGR